MPSLTGHAPTIPGPGEVQEVFQAESGLGGTPRTQQGARGSEALSEDTSFPSGLGLGTLLSAGAGDTLEVLGDLLRCYYRPRAMSSESRGPVSARRWAPLPQTSVWTCRVLESHLLRPGAPPLNLEHPEVAGRCGTPKEATAVRTAYLCARPRFPGASLSAAAPGLGLTSPRSAPARSRCSQRCVLKRRGLGPRCPLPQCPLCASRAYCSFFRVCWSWGLTSVDHNKDCVAKYPWRTQYGMNFPLEKSF